MSLVFICYEPIICDVTTNVSRFGVDYADEPIIILKIVWTISHIPILILRSFNRALMKNF
jgi:hypothetical protein